VRLKAEPRFMYSARPNTGCQLQAVTDTENLWVRANRSWFRCHRTILLTGLALAALSAGVVPMGNSGALIGPALMHAQNLGERVVRGTVVDANSAPLSAATVFIKDLKTKSIRSFTTEAGGKYQFTQVNMAEDHELWAEKDGKKSSVKTVSSWDSRKDFVCELKLK
jgi:hypothetical protein